MRIASEKSSVLALAIDMDTVGVRPEWLCEESCGASNARRGTNKGMEFVAAVMLLLLLRSECWALPARPTDPPRVPCAEPLPLRPPVDVRGRVPCADVDVMGDVIGLACCPLPALVAVCTDRPWPPGVDGNCSVCCCRCSSESEDGAPVLEPDGKPMLDSRRGRDDVVIPRLEGRPAPDDENGR
jgi:hypothetical protein